MTSEQGAERLGVDLPTGEGRVQAAPPAPVCRFEAQMHRRQHRTAAEQRITQVEQGIAAMAEAGVEIVTKVAQQGEWSGGHQHSRASLP